MTRVLICHVPKDGPLARDLGAVLMGHGHAVSFDGEPDAPRDDRAERMRQFEAVIVFWTENSTGSAGVAEAARLAMRLNLLVALRAEGIAPQSLPLAFRKIHMLGLADADALRRTLARLSVAASTLKEIERGAGRPADAGRERDPEDAARPAAVSEPAQAAPFVPAPVPQPVPLPPPAAAPPAHEAYPHGPPIAGPLFEPPPMLEPRFDSGGPRPGGAWERRPPPHPGAPMWPAAQAPAPHMAQAPAPHVTQVPAPRAAAPPPPDAALFAHEIPEALNIDEAQSVSVWLDPAMVVILTDTLAERAGVGARGAPFIETISVSLYAKDDAFEIDRESERMQRIGVPQRGVPLRWAWRITPRAPGDHELFVRISAVLKDQRGAPTPVALPDQSLSVAIVAPDRASIARSIGGWFRG